MKRWFLRLELIAALLLIPLVAQAVIPNGVNLGGHNQTAATNVLTTNANDCPVGALAVISASYATIADTLSSVTDSSVGGPNTWTVIENQTGTGVGLAIAYTIVTADIASGKTISATFSGSTASTIAGSCVSTGIAASPLDTHNNSAQGLAATAATAVNSGALSQPVEIFFGLLVSPTNSGTVTLGNSFTTVANNAASTPALTVGFKIVAVATSQAFAPTWTNTVNYVTDLVSFKGSVAAGRLLLLGVGK